MPDFELTVEPRMHEVLREVAKSWRMKMRGTGHRILLRGLLAEVEAGNLPPDLLTPLRSEIALPPPGYVAPEIHVEAVVEAQAVEVEVEFEMREWWIAGPTTCPGIVVIGEGTNLHVMQTALDRVYVRVMDNLKQEGKPIKGCQTTLLHSEQDVAKVVAWAESESAKQDAPPDVGRIWKHPDACPGGYPLSFGDWAFVVNKGRHYEVMVYNEDGELIHSEELTHAAVEAHELVGKVKKYNEVPLAFNTPTRYEFADHPQVFVRDVNLTERYADPMRECQIEVRDALRVLSKYPPIATEALIANGICTGSNGWVEFKVGGQRFGVRGDRVARINETFGSNPMNPSNIVHPQDMQLILAALEEDRLKWESWGSKHPRMLRDRVGEGFFNRNPFWLWIEPVLDHWRVEFDLDLELWERMRRKLMRSHNNRGYYETETWEFLGNYKAEPQNPQRVHSMEFITEILRLHNESIESREYRLPRSLADYLIWLRSSYR